MLSSANELWERLERAVSVDAPELPPLLTVDSVAALYLAHAAKRYNSQHGAKEVATIRNALAPLRERYGHLHPSELRTRDLLAVQQYFIEVRNNCRSTVQAKMERIGKCWEWLNSLDWFNWRLPTIPKIPYGHVRVREKVRPVPIETVEATLPYLHPAARVLIRLIMYSGMRPGEACSLTPDQLNTSENPWLYTPRQHKGRHLDKDRPIFLGPKAQMLLTSAMTAANAQCIAMSADAATCVATARSTIFMTARGNRFTPKLLQNAIDFACRRHKIPHWHCHQLRHLAATMIRERFGLDSAQAVLGHARIETSQVYAARMDQLASTVALAVG